MNKNISGQYKTSDIYVADIISPGKTIKLIKINVLSLSERLSLFIMP